MADFVLRFRYDLGVLIDGITCSASLDLRGGPTSVTRSAEQFR